MDTQYPLVFSVGRGTNRPVARNLLCGIDYVSLWSKSFDKVAKVRI